MVKLTLLGTNTLTAPAKKAALYCPGGSSLTIEGTGTLNANGHKDGGGAGIGGESARGNFWEDTGICGEITINSGTINAICDTPNPGNNTYVQNTAAIGGWSGGPITINGGKVTAIGGVRSVGIGAYLLTVDNGTGGGTFLANTVHNISAVIPAGMEFVEWRLTSGVGTIMDKKSPDTVFIMGNGPAAVTAVFKDSNGNTPAVLHRLTVVGGNGSGSYPENTSINISAVIPSGKKFDCRIHR